MADPTLDKINPLFQQIRFWVDLAVLAFAFVFAIGKWRRAAPVTRKEFEDHQGAMKNEFMAVRNEKMAEHSAVLASNQQLMEKLNEVSITMAQSVTNIDNLGKRLKPFEDLIVRLAEKKIG